MSFQDKQRRYYLKFLSRLVVDRNIIFRRGRPDTFEDTSNLLWNWRLSSFSTLLEGTTRNSGQLVNLIPTKTYRLKVICAMHSQD